MTQTKTCQDCLFFTRPPAPALPPPCNAFGHKPKDKACKYFEERPLLGTLEWERGEPMPKMEGYLSCPICNLEGHNPQFRELGLRYHLSEFHKRIDTPELIELAKKISIAKEKIA